jgi:hypothetical protein
MFPFIILKAFTGMKPMNLGERVTRLSLLFSSLRCLLFKNSGFPHRRKRR